MSIAVETPAAVVTPPAVPAGPAGLRRFGDLHLIGCAEGPLRWTRPSRASGSGRTGAEGIAVVLPRDGSARLAQGGGAVRLTVGRLAVIDERRPFAYEQEEAARTLVHRLPAHVLNVPGERLGRVLGRSVPTDSGVAAVLAPLLVDLHEAAARLPRAVGERCAGVVTELVAGLVDELADAGGASATETGRAHLVAAARRYIDAHLGDRALSVERVAVALGVSVRYLHRLFEEEGLTVGRLILRRRLEECARELARRGPVHPTIAAVSARWGFSSPAHFSRSFKAVYGELPRAWRRAVHDRAGGG